MTEMSPRERARAILLESRAMLAALRAERRAPARTASAVEGSSTSPIAAATPRKGDAAPRAARAAAAEKAGPRRDAPARADAPRPERPVAAVDALRREQAHLREAAAIERKALLEARRQGAARARVAPTSLTAAREPAATAFPLGYRREPAAPPQPSNPRERLVPPEPARAAPPRPEPRVSVDIDAISGLGSALRSKLRRLGLGAADALAAQRPDQLRIALGPAGRLVNVESLVKAAALACGPAPRGGRASPPRAGR